MTYRYQIYLEPVYGLLTETVAYKGYLGFLIESAFKGTVSDCLLNPRSLERDCLGLLKEKAEPL